MATPYDGLTAQIYGGSAGGSLYDYSSNGAPYPSGITSSRPRSAQKADSMRALYSPLNDLTAKAFGEQSKELQFAIDPLGSMIGGLFGGSDKPKQPYWQRLANREWAQGNAALSAYAQLREPTLALARADAADYGDLWRRASNDQLAFDIRSTTTKRGGDLADFEALGPEYVAQLRATNPLLAKYYDAASGNLDLGSRLSPEQEMELEQYVRGGQAARGMGLGPADLYQEALQKTSFGEQLRQQRMAEARQAAGAYGDIFQATTGRPTMSPAPAGAQIQAPNSGIGVEDYLSYGVNREVQSRNMASAKSSAQMGLAGDIIGGLLGGASGFAAMCWVAREIYGAQNPKWMVFRHWMLNEAPEQLRELYIKNGEKLAAKLKELPALKGPIREFMEEKIRLVGKPVEVTA